MCCDDEFIPPHVARMLARYRQRLTEHGFDWGEDFTRTQRILLQNLGRFAQEEVANAGRVIEAMEDPLNYLVRFLPEELPCDVAVVSARGVKLPKALPLVAPGHPVVYQVFYLADGEESFGRLDEVEVAAENPYLEVGGRRHLAAEVAAVGRLRLRSDAISRWSVVDERGGSWFPDRSLHKFTWRNVPFFHGNDVLLSVPAGRARVALARGCEFQPIDVCVDVAGGQETVVNLSLERLYDAAERGWYGADLHVHMNYVGDDVATPRDVAQMQQGEGLHLLNLVAGNCQTSLVYDQEAFEHYIGQDLPWTHDHTVARWGVEYRNDLLGHFHALNPSAAPTRYSTGHARSTEPQDWPPNSVAAAEFRDLGATVGYTHPVFQPMGIDGSPAAVFSSDKAVRSTEARELVADAALGLVDSVDLGGGSHIEGTEYLYHRLLGCGLRLAASVGTDTMLQNARMWPVSNPPGWFRAYANLDGEQLTVSAWQKALRRGRTFITNGPWLGINLAGSGPGDTIGFDTPCDLHARVEIIGLGVETVEIVGADGVLIRRAVGPEVVEQQIDIDLRISEPTWLAAIARGGEHRAVIGPQVYAHTSPLWVTIGNQSVARPADAEWCLDWLDRLEDFAREHGNFSAPEQFDDLLDVVNDARRFYHRILTKAHRS